MPTWRKLHLKATESLDLNDLPDDFARLLWVLLPLGLDREGRGLDNLSWIKAKIMPLRTDVTLDRIAAAVDSFASLGMILRYQVDGRRYFTVPTWHKYQGDTSREAGSVFPPPPDPAPPPVVAASAAPANLNPDPAPDSLATNSRPPHDLLTTNSPLDSDSDSELDSDSDSDSPTPPSQTGPPDQVGERDDPDPLILYQKTYDLQSLTPAQETTLRHLAAQHGPQRLSEVIAWAADAGIPQARALRAIRTALPGWQPPRRPPSYSTGTSYPTGRAPPPRRKPIDDLIDQLQKKQGGKPWPPKTKSLLP